MTVKRLRVVQDEPVIDPAVELERLLAERDRHLALAQQADAAVSEFAAQWGYANGYRVRLTVEQMRRVVR